MVSIRYRYCIICHLQGLAPVLILYQRNQSRTLKKRVAEKDTSDKPRLRLFGRSRQHLHTFALARLNVVVLAIDVTDFLCIDREVDMAIGGVEAFLF
jgi:hypothetical protein